MRHLLARAAAAQAHPGGRCTTTVKVPSWPSTAVIGTVSTHLVNEPQRWTCSRGRGRREVTVPRAVCELPSAPAAPLTAHLVAPETPDKLGGHEERHSRRGPARSGLLAASGLPAEYRSHARHIRALQTGDRRAGKSGNSAVGCCEGEAPLADNKSTTSRYKNSDGRCESDCGDKAGRRLCRVRQHAVWCRGFLLLGSRWARTARNPPVKGSMHVLTAAMRQLTEEGRRRRRWRRCARTWSKQQRPSCCQCHAHGAHQQESAAGSSRHASACIRAEMAMMVKKQC